jgi:ribosome-associated protein
VVGGRVSEKLCACLGRTDDETLQKKGFSQIETKKKITLICDAASERKAQDIVVMDMGEKSSIAEHFIVMSAPSLVRVKAIVEHVEAHLEKAGLRLFHREGLKEALWVLLDYGEIVVHVFYHETRRFYSLESLWGDAPRRNYHPSH